MRVTAKQYAQTLYDLTDGKAKPEIEKSLADFARYLHKERKLKLSGKIIENFRKIYDRKNGIVEAEVVTAEKISTEIEKKIKSYIQKKYDAKKVVLKNSIDGNIKGGVIIRVGDEVIDGSITGKLSELKKILVK
jgi:F-type H+-transporting ATPase subunit delta